ncbi:MAG: oligopeptide transporter, OPT family [Deltaproteobacteria bacterium]|nr:oligopeptide transporter, OPT family [Deltaproteobacteria bacterium]
MSHAHPGGSGGGQGAGGGGVAIPANAHRELAEGETYRPIVPDAPPPAEITARSLTMGLIMAAVFSFSAAYLGLKVGQVFEAAIPIAILAVGVGVAFKRKSAITENVMVQSIGAASGVVVAGGIFTIPALYILDLGVNLLDTFLAAFLGGCLGILFMIPLRRYFVAEQHGKLPFPEATATPEILVAGETGGKQAGVLGISMLVGGVYDFLADALKGWNLHLATHDSLDRTVSLLGGAGEYLYEKLRLVVRLDSLTAFIGLGYIVGLRYSTIIALGSVLSFVVLVPVVFLFGASMPEALIPDPGRLATMNEWQIFKTFVQKVGIGAIAAAGIIGIIRMSPVILNAFKLGAEQIRRRHGGEGEARRTQTDMAMKTVLIGLALVVIGLAVFFSAKAGPAAGLAGLAIVAVLAFLFTTVAGYATAVVGTNPVSGMTLITLLVLSLVMAVIVPLEDATQRRDAMATALIMGCVVCTALSMAGGFVTDLKIGYWVGSTPRNQQRFKFLGTLVAAVSVAGAILLIQMAYGFAIKDPATGAMSPNPAVPAPQGNLMATIIQSAMDPTQAQPWALYGVGAIVAIILALIKVPPLPFALGMYLPIQLNVPLVIGGLLAWLIGRSSKDPKVVDERGKRGTLIASGFIAGGALMGMIGAILNLDGIGKPIRFVSIGGVFVQDPKTGAWAADHLADWVVQYGQFIGLALFVGLCVWMYRYSKAAARD